MWFGRDRKSLKRFKKFGLTAEEKREHKRGFRGWDLVPKRAEDNPYQKGDEIPVMWVYDGNVLHIGTKGIVQRSNRFGLSIHWQASREVYGM